jgi:hypothetical protein
MFRQSSDSTSFVATMLSPVHRRIEFFTPLPIAMNARSEHILTKVTWFVPLVRLEHIPTLRDHRNAYHVQLVHILTKLEQLNALSVLLELIMGTKDQQEKWSV